MRYLDRMDAKLRGHREIIGQRALLPLPLVDYDACEEWPGRMISLFPGQVQNQRLLGACRPRAPGSRCEGYVDRVVIGCGFSTPTGPISRRH